MAHTLELLPEVRAIMANHYREWNQCTKCRIGEIAFQHVFARGTLPCQVLFIGEAPGKTEDLLGYPFVGKAGKLLDEWIGYAKVEVFRQMEQEEQIASLFKPATDAGFSYAIANLTLCRPTNEQGGYNRPPTPEEIRNCQPRLLEFVEMIAKPSAIVTLGKPAGANSPEWEHMPRLSLPHPSWHLHNGRNNIASTIEDAERLTAFIMKEVL